MELYRGNYSTVAVPNGETVRKTGEVRKDQHNAVGRLSFV